MENFAPSLCFKGIKIHYVVFRLPVVLVGTHWDNHQLSFFFGLRILLRHIHISSCLPAPPLAHCLMRKPKCNFRTRRLYQRGLSLLQGQNMSLSHFGPSARFQNLYNPSPFFRQSLHLLITKNYYLGNMTDEKRNRYQSKQDFCLPCNILLFFLLPWPFIMHTSLCSLTPTVLHPTKHLPSW